ncbi:hypothetical protein P262_00603 [Cronobacter malonaticus]|uniref:Uncharacterized protein n=1 Tax=Cronobacter malonaticus TaxID=413503 RepID=V5TU57_9ENTR|nr:hypothetical protein P262_00603 [Cronobacter malonaticus]
MNIHYNNDSCLYIPFVIRLHLHVFFVGKETSVYTCSLFFSWPYYERCWYIAHKFAASKQGLLRN